MAGSTSVIDVSRSAAALLSLLLAVPVAAAAYPEKPLRLVVPFAAGGTNDVIARLVGRSITDALGQQVILDNRGGAGGAVGVEIAARAAPDGYTLLIGGVGNLAVNPTLYPKLPYDPVRDFAPVTLLAKVPNLLAVHPGLPARNVRELVALAQAKPGSLNYGSGGTGSGSHLAAEYFKLLAKTDIVHVPYKGTGPAMIDVMGGQISMIFAAVPGLLPHTNSGKLRALGVSTATRLRLLPDVPTIIEGGVSGYEATQWFGILLPARTSPAIVERLNSVLRSALNNSEVRQRLQADAAEPAGTTPAEFGLFIQSEIARWAPVVKASGARPE